MEYREFEPRFIDSLEEGRRLIFEEGLAVTAVANFRGILPGGFLRNFSEQTGQMDTCREDLYSGKTIREFFADVDEAIEKAGLDPVVIEGYNKYVAYGRGEIPEIGSVSQQQQILAFIVESRARSIKAVEAGTGFEQVDLGFTEYVYPVLEILVAEKNYTYAELIS